MTNTFLEKLESAGKAVQPLATGEMIDYSNVPGAIVRYVRSDRKKPGAGQTRDWQLHIFRMPNGETFALGGCLELDSRLRSCKTGDVLALAYMGQKDIGEGRSQHQWSVTLVTITGVRLDSLIDECGPVYQAIREAVATKARERLSRNVPADDAPPPHTDSDAPVGKYSW